jgi:GT2 family glycosyltransferase
MNVSIIIPVLNNLHYTNNCINSILDDINKFKKEIIVIDNGSTDNTSSILKNLYPQINVITNNTNLGFAKACNQGAKKSSGDMLIFLNNDTQVTNGWIEKLVNCIKSQKHIGIVGCKLLYPDKTIQHAGVAFSATLVHHIYRNFSPCHPAVNRQREFQAVTAACMLLPRKIFTALGGFDETFTNGFEDLDLCFRVRRKGLKVIYTPECVVIHHESKTQGRHDQHDHNASLFSSRWTPSIVQDLDSIYAEDGLRRLVAYEKKFGGIWFEDSNPNPSWLKAKFLAGNGKHIDAEINYRLALSFNPYDIRRLSIAEELGDLYMIMDRVSDATACYDAILPFHASDSLLNKIARTRQSFFPYSQYS